MKKKSLLPADVIEQWPEIFSAIEVKAVPLAYLYSMKITFKDGKVWSINIAAHAKKAGVDNLEKHIQELLATYDEVIANVDFQLDVNRVKKDITKQTTKFLKAVK